MAWTSLSFSVGQILTAAQMNQLYDNFAAMANGDSGAPEIFEAALAAAVSGQLVTNGDSHNHNGGDGAQINHNNLSNNGSSTGHVTNGDSHNHSGGDGAAIPYSGLSLSNDLVAGDIAPNAINQSEMGDSAVGTAELKSTTADHNFTFGFADSVEFGTEQVLTGGQYLLGVQQGISGGAGTDEWLVTFGKIGGYISSSDVKDAGGFGHWMLGFNNYHTGDVSRNTFSNVLYVVDPSEVTEISNNDTFKLRERYIQSSPPYDLGDGEVYGFIFAQMKPDGTIAAFSIMEDPPWHNNGPTDCSPDKYHYSKDKTQKTPVKLITRVDGLCWMDVRDDEQKRAHYLKMRAQGKNITKDYEPISQAMKNADIDIIPTNWARPNRNNTLVMLDPMSEVTRQVMEMKQEGIDVFEELFFKDYMKIDNTKINRKGPKALRPVEVKWK